MALLKYEDYLYHHGVKGMKWGVRRYQNEDGSLTNAGKKKISKEYKKESVKTQNALIKRRDKMRMDAYNKTADKMNNGGIAKFNEEQRKKHGNDYANRDGYMDDYNNMFEKEFAKNWNKSISDFYATNKNAKRAQELVDKYKMTSWDNLAKSNSEAIQSVRDALKSVKLETHAERSRRESEEYRRSHNI